MQLPSYSLTQFEADIQNVKPRIFDTYILPPFIMWFAVRSKSMGKNARRALFAAGIFMFYRNYAEYKRAYDEAMKYVSGQP